MALTAAEQYLIELINRARLDPLAEASRYGIDLNADLPGGTIGVGSKQVLAPNAKLETAAVLHSQWMLATDTFSHTGSYGTNPGQRMADAGYEFSGGWSWRENLAWSGTTGAIDLAASIDVHHEGLIRSAGHRVNIFGAEVREVGIGQVQGVFTSGGVNFNASMLTENFALSGTQVFVTGVAYADRDGDAFYDIGEARTDVWFRAGDTQTDVAEAGGYAIGIAPAEAVQVTIGSGTETIAELLIDMSAGNGKLDLVSAANGIDTLALSASATLVSGAANARLLGLNDLSLVGSGDDNILFGNAGNNLIDGGAGRDSIEGGAGDDLLRGGAGRDAVWRSATDAETSPLDARGFANADLLSGGAGNDRLFGQSGHDLLIGGAGDDRLMGGGGRDVFVFETGRDTIVDFTSTVDSIVFDAAALGLAGQTVDDVLERASVRDGSVVFDFGGDNRLTLSGISDLTQLANDLEIV